MYCTSYLLLELEFSSAGRYVRSIKLRFLPLSDLSLCTSTYHRRRPYSANAEMEEHIFIRWYICMQVKWHRQWRTGHCSFVE